MERDRESDLHGQGSVGKAAEGHLVSDFMQSRVARLLQNRPTLEAGWILEKVILTGVPDVWGDALKGSPSELLTKYYQSRGNRRVCSERGPEDNENHTGDAIIMVRDMPLRKGDRESVLKRMEEEAEKQGEGYQRLTAAMRETLAKPMKPYRRKEGRDVVITEPATYIGWDERMEGYRTVTGTPIALFRLTVSLKAQSGRTKTRMERVPRLVIRVERAVGAEASDEFRDAMKMCLGNLVECVASNALSCLSFRFESDEDGSQLVSPDHNMPLRVVVELEEDAHGLSQKIHQDLDRRLRIPLDLEARDLRKLWYFDKIDIGWLETVKVTSTAVREAEMAREERTKAKAAANAKPPPGDEFLLLAFVVDTLVRRDDGAYGPRHLHQYRSNLIDEWGMKPEQLLEEMGVKASWFDGELDWDEVTRRVLDAVDEVGFDTDECGSDDNVVMLARDAARLCGGRDRVETSDLVLRLLVDSGSGATFARLAPREGRLAMTTGSFLRMATEPGEKDSFGFKPLRLKVPNTLRERVQGVTEWCSDFGAEMVAPRSGFDAGAHHVKAWKQELGTNYEFWEMGRSKKTVSVEQLMARTKLLSMETTGCSPRRPRDFSFLKVGTTVDYAAWQKVKAERLGQGRPSA